MGNVDTDRLTYEPLTRAAARTGLSVQDLRRCIATGRLNAYRCGSRIIRLDPREVNVLGEAQGREGVPEGLPPSIRQKQ